MSRALSQSPRPGQHMTRVPTFDLAVLEALAAWRDALRDKAEAMVAYRAATASHERGCAVQRADRAGIRIARARKAVEDALREDVGGTDG